VATPHFSTLATDEPVKGSAWPVLRAALGLGCRSFGGPVAHLGYFEREYVGRRRWLAADEYAGIVALCQVLPGPTSSQVGFLVGLHRAGWRGAFAAWLGFTLPSAALMYAFYLIAPRISGPAMNLVLYALKWVTVAVVARAVFSMARSLCPDVPRASIALTVAIVLCFTHGALQQAVLLAASAIAGSLLCKDVRFVDSGRAVRIEPRVVGFAVAAGAGLLIALSVLASRAPHGVAALGEVFFRSGSLVFGGGHVVLPLLHDALVPAGWISNNDFLTGYGAAQALPGPLFAVSAYFGAVSAPPGLAALGAAVAVLCIFLPGMVLAVAGRSLWQRLARAPRARAALAGVNAGAVGILAAALYNPVLTGALQPLVLR
jgi:chromate transporter